MILLLLLLAHLTADFLLQSDFLAKEKARPRVLIGYLALHACTIGLALGVYLLFGKALRLSSIITALLFLLCARGFLEMLSLQITKKVRAYTQRAKPRAHVIEKIPDVLRNWRLALFIGNHLMQMAFILLISRFCLGYDIVSAGHKLFIKLRLLQGHVMLSLPDRLLFLLLVLFLVTVFSGHLIALIAPKPLSTDFEFYEGKITYESDSPQTSFFQSAKKLDLDQMYVKLNNPQISRGKTIGYLERIIVMILILANQYSAIAFIITAKSLFRFKQLNHREWAEYFLVGTLASVMLGLTCGILLRLVLE